jgi:hypothetical protein
MVTIDTMLERWSGLERPLFKGKLIDAEGCKCAQGDVLFCAGFTDAQLRNMEQSKADRETATILGISRTHAVLLRNVNDKSRGCPQLVLSHPEQIIGDKAPILLAFWLYLDNMSDAARDAGWDAACAAAWDAGCAAAWAAACAAAWDAARDAGCAAACAAAWDAARDAGWDAACAAAWAVARAAAGAAAWAAAGAVAWAAAWAAAGAAAWAAAGASTEIQGMDKLEADGREPYFLAFFGLKTWDEVRVLAKP